jgi:hypothetical protein
MSRSYDELIQCLVDEEEKFVDTDWKALAEVKTVEPVEEFAEGWSKATLYQLLQDPSRVCLFFGDDEYEGLDPPYTFIDGVVKDGDGDAVEFVDPVLIVCDSNKDKLVDPELQELEENGGGYLSDTDDDSDSDFLFGGDGDKKIVKL